MSLFGSLQLGMPYWLMGRGLRSVSPQEAGAITLLEPLFVGLWAYLIDPVNETPGWNTLIGGLLILGALARRYACPEPSPVASGRYNNFLHAPVGMRFAGSPSMKLPGASRPLLLFAVSLVIVGCSLMGMLFGVRLEALVPATGLIEARDQHELRVRRAGLIEPGWYEGTLRLPDGSSRAVRMDDQGNGISDPTAGSVWIVTHYQARLSGGTALPVERNGSHHLLTGDEVWGGQPVAVLRGEEFFSIRHTPAERFGGPELRPVLGTDSQAVRPDALTLKVPETPARWLVLAVPVTFGQAVHAGGLVASLAPLEAEGPRLRDLQVRLRIAEKHFGQVAPGQDVRLASTMYSSRLYGYAHAVIDRLEPLGEDNGDGGRIFHAIARVTEAPYDLRIGSSVQAEIRVGKKRTYQIILEH